MTKQVFTAAETLRSDRWRKDRNPHKWMINKDNLHIRTEVQFIAGIGVLKGPMELPKVWTFALVGPKITQSVRFFSLTSG